MSRLGLLLVPLILVAVPVVPERESVPFGQGMHVFRALLKVLGVEPLKDFDQLLDKPANTVLVVLGHTDRLDRWLTEGHSLTDEFLKRGGAVLIATDRPTSNGLFGETHVKVSGEFVPTPQI